MPLLMIFSNLNQNDIGKRCMLKSFKKSQGTRSKSNHESQMMDPQTINLMRCNHDVPMAILSLLNIFFLSCATSNKRYILEKNIKIS